MTMRFTLEDTATIQGVLRRRMEVLQPNSMQFYEDAAALVAAQAPVGHPPGFYVAECGLLKRIPNSIPLEHGGTKQTIVRPLSVVTVDAVDDVPEPEPVALPSPLADVADDIAKESREIFTGLDGDAGDEVEGDDEELNSEGGGDAE